MVNGEEVIQMLCHKRTRNPVLVGRKNQINRLLAVLGLPTDRVYARKSWDSDRCRRRGATKTGGSSFWIREEDNLESWLHEAHDAYRHQVKKIRPDLVANHEVGTELNLAWSKVRELFGRRGIEL
jgi:hypothetical protein